MIVSASDKRVWAILEGRVPKRLPPGLMRAAQKRLLMLDSADSLTALMLPPSNRLEALEGDRKGQHSIRINRQWRICFRWNDGEARDVEIVDYH